MDPYEVLEAQNAWLRAARTGGANARIAAEQSLHGLRRAAVTLLANLAELHYPAVPGIVAPEAGLEDRITTLAATVGGPVPPGLAAFWKIVGGLSLVDLSEYRHVAFWESLGISGKDGFCDGVHVDSCDSDWLAFALDDFSNWTEDPVLQVDPFLLSLAPDGYHKDDISGGAAYGIACSESWLAPWRNFAWVGARRPVSASADVCDLISYLRTALLECAGFPALHGVHSFDPIRQQLLRGIQVC